MHAVRAAIRSVARDSKAVDEIICEDSLVPLDRPEVKCEIHDDLLVEAKLSRKCIGGFVNELEDTSGEAIYHMFRSKLPVLKSMDRYSTIEAAFFDTFCGKDGNESFTRSVAGTMPTLTEH